MKPTRPALLAAHRAATPAPATLAALLHEQAERQGDAPALLAPGREALSYAGLQAQALRLAGHLQALGATPSTRVAVVLPNGPEMAVAFLGVAGCAACAPLNPASAAAELRFHLQDLRANMIVLRRGTDGPARAVAQELGLAIIEIEADDAGPAGCFRLVGERAPPAQTTPFTPCTPDDVALLLHTSGTTARPKLVPLSQANLVASARNIAAHLALSGTDRCLNVMPLFHIHGLVGALLASLAGGGSVVCTPGFDERGFFDSIAAFKPTWYTAVPTIHQAVLANGAAYRLKAPAHHFRFARSSSAALPAATLRALQALLQAPVVEAYGMTEASHQMASNPVQRGEQTAGSVGVAAGADVAILDPAGRLLGAGQEGEIAVRGPGVMRGYESGAHADAHADPRADTAANAPSDAPSNAPSNAEAFHDGWFRTGDLGHLDSLGRLTISGRLKEIVNRGGEKVSPREVDDALLDHPDVLQAAAFGVPHPSLGEDLAAAVVLRAGSEASEQALRAHLLTRLAAFKVPSQIVRVHAIPAGATGKVERKSLHRALNAALARAFVAPRTEHERALEAIFGEMLGCRALGVHDNFFAAGGDSLRGARVVARVNERFGRNLPATSLFEHPSVAELAALLEAPVATEAPESPKVLEASESSEWPGVKEARPSSVPASQPGAAQACSFSQQALWMVERLAIGTGAYNSAQAVRLSGGLDVPALERALQALLQRHDVLRTGFDEIDGSPLQRVHADAVLTLARADMRGMSEAAAPAAGELINDTPLMTDLAAEVRRPFDLTQPPLLRAGLWRLDDSDGQAEHLLLLVAHHIVADGWSMQVVAHDLGVLYSAFRDLPAPAPAAPALAPLPIRFADWAAQQRRWLQGPRLEADLHYWRGRLAGLTPLASPTDRPRPPQPSWSGGSERFSLPPALVAKLRALARERKVTLFMLLLAAFKVLLMRCTHQHDVAVGSPVAGRDRPELECLVGCFVNTVVLRTDLSGNPSFVELLDRVRETALAAYRHQALPFEKLVAELSPRRDLSRNPLFQVSFALDNQPTPVYVLGGVTARRVTLPAQTAKFDLLLTFTEAETDTTADAEIESEGSELQGRFEYSSDLFEPATVQRLSSHLRILLEGIALNAGQRIARLPLMSDAEWRHMAAWNETARPTPAAMVHERVEQQARRVPDAVALVFGEARLSYRQLNARANQLAHYLRRHGAGPEVLVTVCLERSLDLVVAMLAVPKAGAALVPLDPELPEERLAFVLQDTASPLTLTQSGLVSRLPPPAGGRERHVLCLDTQWDLMAQESEADPVGATAPEQLAYVIYTSGSTGKPKGVLLEHGGWRNHAHWLQQTLSVVPGDRFLQISSIGFDAAMVELFMSLQAGATLVLAAPGEHRDTAYLARLMQEQGVTVLQMVPSALRSLLAEPLLRPGRLRWVVSGGEALDPRMATELQQRLPDASLGNFYGPTETTIHSTHFGLPPPSNAAGPSGGASVTIGRPIANTQCFVLDDDLQAVPVGVMGELWIGGAGLARGYLDRPELTAERFIRHPESGQRLYRTGDLARYRADGNIDYLGRADFQVKIRGHRIELGEIEAALKALPGVRDGVVVARADAAGQQRLVAYVVAHVAGGDVALADLRAALARTLPESMLPGAFVLLAELPTLPSGKIDRKALPEPEQPAQNAAAVAPRTPTERAVGQIWRDVLGIEHVGVHDHFFELGGHSLTAMQVVARLRVGLQLELPLRTLFSHPTLETLAAEIDSILSAGPPGDSIGRDGAALVDLPVIPTIARDGPLLASYSQRRMWLVQALNPQTTAYNMSFALRLRGTVNADALVAAIDWVVQRHEAFRTRFGMLDGEVVQWIDPPSPTQIDRIDLRHLPAEAREREARKQREQAAGRSFDLASSGLYRLSLLQTSDAEHVLLWLMHHVIGDHWTDGILLREVGQAYGALLQGRAPVLPALRIEYADYAAWQRAPAQRERLAPQMAWWTDRLRGLRPLPMPFDLSWRELPSGRGSSLSARLAASTVAALKRFSPRHGVTPFMAMLACFNVVLSRYCGQTDIVVGSPVANRTRVESESLIGTLVNTLVMRSDLSGDPTFVELLARVKDTTLEAFAHQDAPFERLVEETTFERSATRQPLVQVLFNVINAPFDVKAMPGITLERFDYTSIAAQFELGLTVDDAFGIVHMSYSTDLFVRSTAERVLASFLTVMDCMLADPTRRVADCETRGAAEQTQLAAWNATELPFEPGLRLGDLIRRQMLRAGDAPAVIFEDRYLSGSELDARARALALRLRALGAGPGSLVGVCLKRGMELVAALVGVVYSGAAFVPLDPAYPAERLARMAEDAGMTLVLSRAAEWQGLRPALPPNLRMIDVDGDDDDDGGRADGPAQAQALALALANFELIGSAEDPAYVIFTSGSTGRPKGAMNAHCGVVNWLQWMQAEYALTPQDRVLLKTPYSFDVSLREFLWPLMTGATIVVARPDGHRDAAYLAELIRRERITLLHFVPSMLRIFLDEPGLEQCTSVRRVVCSGEALPADAVDLFFRRLPHSRLCNLYGPTEAAVEVTYWECRPGDGEGGASIPNIPIGRPVANTQMHVLDSRLRPQPVGVAGDLYIGGVQVGMGYVGRPELTAERFIADPFRPGGRLYKTGDLARWTRDGVLDYLGRADDQVKLRGHRIELGEIEACLGTHAEVARCAVTVREDVAGDKRLVAYVVSHGAAPDAAALRDHLRISLPEFMLPQHFVAIDALPLLPNGKLDRRALPRPDPASPGQERRRDEREAPRTDAEKAVAAVWQSLLGVRHVGRSDNFFDLGGHSLLAMRAVSELERRLGTKLELRKLVFESLAQVAAAIDHTAGPRDPAPQRHGLFRRLLRSPRRSA